MRPRQNLPTRTALITVTFAVLASVFAGAADADTNTERHDPATSSRMLVKLDNRELGSDHGKKVREIGGGWFLIDAPNGRSDLVAHLKGRGIPWEPDLVYELATDPLFDDQWGLENTGQLGGTIDADIDALDAWAASTGNPSQIIAVIDSGVDLDHPDLIDRIWVNTKEIPANGLDDDANGYIDDVNGWDAVSGDALPDDELGHGTAVAGVAAASSNGVGVVGVAPQATIMPIRVCTGNCPLSAIVEGVHYAIDNGAQIINMSLGSHSPSQALTEAITAAHAANVLIVAAAGNDGTDNDSWPFYPASIDLPNVISVAASDRNDELAAFIGDGSNYGATTVDLAAPGKAIVTSGLGGWVEASGTSFAAPMVAGASALLLDLRPDATPEQVIAVLVRTVDKAPSMEAKTVSGGRLNASAAVLAAEPPIAVAAGSPLLGWRPLRVSVSAFGSSDPGGGPLVSEWTTSVSTTFGFENEIVLSDVGVQKIVLEVTDDLGTTATDSLTVLVGEDFIDTRSSIFRLDIAWLSALGITKGCNPPANDSFCPNDGVTRGEMAAFIVRSLALPATGNDFFTDDDGSVFEDDINRLAAAGITKGCNPPDNTEFCPDHGVTRAQMASLIARAFDLPHSGTDFFVDDNGSIFEDDINRLAAAGITRGCNPPDNTRFCPSDVMTRQQMAAVLRRGNT